MTHGSLKSIGIDTVAWQAGNEVKGRNGMFYSET